MLNSLFTYKINTNDKGKNFLFDELDEMPNDEI